jgi:hypothetical protein
LSLNSSDEPSLSPSLSLVRREVRERVSGKSSQSGQSEC